MRKVLTRFGKISIGIFAICTFSRIALGEESATQKTVPAETENAETQITNFNKEAAEAIKDFENTLETRTDIFSIFSKDIYSARRVAELAEKLEGHVETLLSWKYFTGNTYLQVTLVEENSDIPAIFGKDSRGNITCTISQKIEDLSDFQIAEILSNALVAQYASANGIVFSGNSTPLWLVAALATETEITRKSGRYLMLRERALSEKPLSLKELFEKKIDGNAIEERFRQNAFWFYRFLRKQKIFPSRNYGETIKEVLKNPQTLNPSNLSDSAINLRWATAFYSTIEKSPAGTEGISKSRERFFITRSFTISANNEDKKIDASMLIPLRNSAEIKKLAYERANEILNGIKETNPVWFNSFVELGTFLEMLAQPEEIQKSQREGMIWAPAKGTQKELREKELKTQWEKVESTLSDAEMLSKEIREILQKVEKK